LNGRAVSCMEAPKHSVRRADAGDTDALMLQLVKHAPPADETGPWYAAQLIYLALESSLSLVCESQGTRQFVGCVLCHRVSGQEVRIVFISEIELKALVAIFKTLTRLADLDGLHVSCRFSGGLDCLARESRAIFECCGFAVLPCVDEPPTETVLTRKPSSTFADETAAMDAPAEETAAGPPPAKRTRCCLI
jgi:hypothetical protein